MSIEFYLLKISLGLFKVFVLTAVWLEKIFLNIQDNAAYMV